MFAQGNVYIENLTFCIAYVRSQGKQEERIFAYENIDKSVKMIKTLNKYYW